MPKAFFASFHRRGSARVQRLMPISTTGTSYDIFGEDNSHNVVLIHGLGLNRNITWDNIVTDLQREFRVVTYDLCGHGETTMPDKEVTLSYLSNQLIELLDELEIGQATLNWIFARRYDQSSGCYGLW